MIGNIVPIVLAALDFNFTNFTTEGVFKVSFSPFIHIFGNYFFPMLLGVIGSALYANERSLGTITVYLILMGAFFAIVFPQSMISIFMMLLAFALAVTFYKAFLRRDR